MVAVLGMLQRDASVADRLAAALPRVDLRSAPAFLAFGGFAGALAWANDAMRRSRRRPRPPRREAAARGPL